MKLLIVRRRSRLRRGATIIEFAIALPFLLCILLGVMEFGWLSRNTAVISNAAREGARYASIGGLQSDIYERVVLAATPLLKTDANGDVINGDIVMDWCVEGPLFPQVPVYLPFPADTCPASFNPDMPGTALRGVKPAKGKKIIPPAAQPLFQLVPHTGGQPAFTLVKKPVKPTPTPTPSPTSTPLPTPDPAPEVTPEPAPTPGPTPTLAPTDSNVEINCKNNVLPRSIVRVTVTLNHTPITRFFPFLNNRKITVTQAMRREEN
jgi:hypothetical protein